jgi:heme exporter protein D
MYFHSWSAFLAMGGYAFFVWSAYAISLLLLAGYFAAIRQQRKRIRRHIKLLIAREMNRAGVDG